MKPILVACSYGLIQHFKAISCFSFATYFIGLGGLSILCLELGAPIHQFLRMECNLLGFFLRKRVPSFHRNRNDTIERVGFHIWYDFQVVCFWLNIRGKQDASRFLVGFATTFGHPSRLIDRIKFVECLLGRVLAVFGDCR